MSFALPSPPNRPTLYFVGVTTGASFINRLFPVWAQALDLAGTALVGIDLPLDAPAAAYRSVLGFLAAQPLARGALVTTHKLGIYAHAHDLFVRLDANATRLSEISAIAVRADGLHGSAKDPVTAGFALQELLAPKHWRDHDGATAVILGCGGAALALALHLTDRQPPDGPATITLTDIDARALNHARGCLAAAGERLRLRRVAGASDNAALVTQAPAHSLIVNATRVGKDRPGTPLDPTARFPLGARVWEFNYRGDLAFLTLARQQAAARQLTIADGWTYFLHGWSQVIAEVFDLDIDAARFAVLERLAGELRQARARRPAAAGAIA